MAEVVVEGLRKSFRIAKRRAGMLGALTGVLRREHRLVEALAGVSFTLERGDLVGYIGPNGAGKSTTIKILSGILVPDAGRCEVLGRVPWRQRVEHVAHIGVVFGQRTQLWWDLPVIESFELLREIYGVEPSAYSSALEELVDTLGLSKILDTPVRQLSLGQRMRCDLAAALLHTPRILFLDEPTIGLDATSKLAVRRFIKRLNEERGTTVILTTHDMDDIEALCSRVLVVDDGRLFCDGDLQDLRDRVGGDRWLTVDLEDDAVVELEGVKVVDTQGRRVVLSFDPRLTTPATLIARVTERYRVRDLFVEHPPIEEIITRLYGNAGDGPKG